MVILYVFLNLRFNGVVSYGVNRRLTVNFIFLYHKQKIMAAFTFTPENSEKVKIKFLRKYRDLAVLDLNFSPGNEEALVLQLMDLVKRDRKYIEFTLQKAIADNGNRL